MIEVKKWWRRGINRPSHVSCMCTCHIVEFSMSNLPLSSPPVAIPLKNMNTPSMATWTERGTITIAECRGRGCIYVNNTHCRIS